jgi:WhiB family redox-sensing transcriptional regulator
VTTALTIDPIVAGRCATETARTPHLAGSFDEFDVAAAGADILLEAALPATPVPTDDLPCRVEDADLWFSEAVGELEQAKQFCTGCPAQRACLAGALARREPWGVWGGQIFERGVVIARKRPRGRPRKDATEIAA